MTARIVIRYRPGIDSSMRLLHSVQGNTTIYNIEGVLPDPNSGREYLTLPVSGVTEIESVKVGEAEIEYKSTTSRRLTVVSTQTSMSGCITFKAGIDILKHPDVKAWMLLACGWLYSQRELLLTGTQPAMPNIAESLLCSISVPSGF